MDLWNYDGPWAGPLAMVVAWVILGAGTALVVTIWCEIKYRIERDAVDRVYRDIERKQAEQYRAKERQQPWTSTGPVWVSCPPWNARPPAPATLRSTATRTSRRGGPL